MGSGKRFRVIWENSASWGLGASVELNSEHRVSIGLYFLKLYIYIGFGKGYEDF